MKKLISMTVFLFMLITGLVALSPAPATAKTDRDCTPSTTTTQTIEHPAVTHVVHHEGKAHIEWHYVKYTHTKTKPKNGQWSAYGPWTKWTPIAHESWETFNVEGLGTPAFHAQGTYADGTQWYREWQARNTGETRFIVDEAPYDETVIDSVAWTETVTVPGSPVECTAHAKTQVKVDDHCNCYRDHVTMTGGPNVKIKASHPSKLTWKFVVTGKKVGDTQYLLPSKIGGNSGWAVTQTYLVHTTNKVCPCKKNGTCHQQYPNYPGPANPCKGNDCK